MTLTCRERLYANSQKFCKRNGLRSHGNPRFWQLTPIAGDWQSFNFAGLVRRSGATSNPRDGLAGGIAPTTLVRVEGLEPPRFWRQNLNLVRLPVPPHPHRQTEPDCQALHASAGASISKQAGDAKRNSASRKLATVFSFHEHALRFDKLFCSNMELVGDFGS